MPFPQTNRVLYDKNPLVEVVCQLRFPPILSINQSNLADFQSHIRDVYPLYSTAGSEVQPLYEFSTEDEKWKISLSVGHIALTCSEYRTWDDFKEKLQQPREYFEEIFHPRYYTRIGLRYQDMIVRSRIGLDSIACNALL